MYLNTGSRLRFIPDFGVDIFAPSAAGVNWWNAGGCPDSAWADVWTAKTAASYAAAKVGNVNGTVLTEGNGAVPWDAVNGLKFTAASAQCLIKGGVSFSTGAHSFIICVKNHNFGATEECLCGSVHTTYLRMRAFVSQKTSALAIANHGLYSSVVTTADLVVYAAAAKPGYKTWKNGVELGALSADGNPASPLANFCLGARWNLSTSTPVLFCTADILAFGHANTDISAYVPALSAAMAAL